MSIAFLQTSDSRFYYPMLLETAKTVSLYCNRNGINYIQYVGTRNGNMPWKSSYNRIYMLKDLLDSGFSGWAFYLDADSFIIDLEFDIEEYLSDKSEFAAIFSGHLEGVPYNINSGGFAINFRHPIGRRIVRDYYDAFAKFDHNTFIDAVYWEIDAPEDQWILHSILKKYVEEMFFQDKFLFEHPNASYVNDGPFIRQSLRSLHNNFQDRLEFILRETSAILLGTEREEMGDPGIAYFSGDHPKLLTRIGKKGETCIYTNGLEEGFLLYGPYIRMKKGTYVAKIYGKVLELPQWYRRTFKCDIAYSGGQTIVAEKYFRIKNPSRFLLELLFVLPEDVGDLEVRVRAFKGVGARLLAVKIEKAAID